MPDNLHGQFVSGLSISVRKRGKEEKKKRRKEERGKGEKGEKQKRRKRRIGERSKE